MKSENLTGTDAEHPASGTIKVEGDTVLLENVNITEAPDGRVILTKDFDETTGVNLGKLQGFTGSHQYSIPEGTASSKYNTVLIWCDQFKVPIGKAEL
ncbi:MAG: DM13 domain-containing protein [Nitrospina sp.]|nr:DM13 domain-containing protein [Nitrospina sp.]MBT3509333.1 DM13 domain-containing protein [Nitrospina sp.]MBT3876127.1 DM13 domain-containing protein [Nitrospina sp.]MBT4048884.1 DM13 domain-containing protein [Nitrospina sp.]MBT4557593.1 DM13 domain-containing protein [Nitrospina sp.]